jgi:hypothetical protein
VYVVSSSVKLSTISASITGPSTATIAQDHTDTSYGFNVELLANNWKTLQLLAGWVNNQTGWTCSVSTYANKVLDSTGLDVLAHTDAKTAAITHTGYIAAIVDWINHNTKSQYTATEVARGEPTVATYQFAGGTTPTIVAADWTDALDVIATGVEEGGILLVNSDDATVMASVVSWIDEQRTAGKWFRAYFGLPEAYTVTQYADLAGAIDHSGVRLTCQRIGVYKSDNSIEYLHPVYLAAMLAGGASGNNPWVPLTNKRVRIADVHASDRYNLVDRETLLVSGITVLKEEIQQWYVDMNVTTSRDPDKRMVRLVSEIDTANLVDARMRRAFLQFRGKWASGSIGARVTLVKRRVLDPFVTDGALVPGTDVYGNSVPAWRDKAIGPNGESWIIEEGVLKLGYSIYMAGELNHVSLDGNAEYVKLAGSVTGNEADIVTTVPTR